jgi:peptidylprolyl isomerase
MHAISARSQVRRWIAFVRRATPQTPPPPVHVDPLGDLRASRARARSSLPEAPQAPRLTHPCANDRQPRNTNNKQQAAAAPASSASRAAPRAAAVVARAGAPNTKQQPIAEEQQPTRRALLAGAALALAAAATPSSARATSLPEDANAGAPLLCDASCAASLEKDAELVTTPSGLQYRDIVVGTGPKPVVGFQVVCDYIAMTPNGKVFANSLDGGNPYDIRVGAGQVIPGLDEGLLTMKVGGVRRLYIPGNLAFPKGLKAAAGRPSVPPSSPVVFDVALRYIPGLEEDE